MSDNESRGRSVSPNDGLDGNRKVVVDVQDQNQTKNSGDRNSDGDDTAGKGVSESGYGSSSSDGEENKNAEELINVLDTDIKGITQNVLDETVEKEKLEQIEKCVVNIIYIQFKDILDNYSKIHNALDSYKNNFEDLNRNQNLKDALEMVIKGIEQINMKNEVVKVKLKELNEKCSNTMKATSFWFTDEQILKGFQGFPETVNGHLRLVQNFLNKTMHGNCGGDYLIDSLKESLKSQIGEIKNPLKSAITKMMESKCSFYSKNEKSFKDLETELGKLEKKIKN